MDAMKDRAKRPEVTTEPRQSCAAVFSDNDEWCKDTIKLLENSYGLRTLRFSYIAHDATDFSLPPLPRLFIMDACRFEHYRSQCLRKISSECPGVPIIMLLRDGEIVSREDASRKGAAGFLRVRSAEEHLVEAVRCVLDGNIYMSQRLFRSTIDNLCREKNVEPRLELAALSDRELEVFGTIVKGKSTRQAASELSINVKTVETYKLRIREKLGIKSARELTHLATCQLGDKL